MMNRFPSGLLDALTYVGAAAGIFFLWTVCETQIIEPYGLYAYMPFYRVDGACAWDVAAIAAISAAFILGIRLKKRPS